MVNDSLCSRHAICIRLYKNREPSLDELSVPIAIASSPFGQCPLSVIIVEPTTSPPKSVDRAESIIPIQSNGNGSILTVQSLFGSNRLAAFICLSNIYRSSNLFTPFQIQALADWIAAASSTELSELVSASGTSNGKLFLIHLVNRILPEVQTVPILYPTFPTLSSSGLFSSLILSASGQLSTIALALTLEASHTPLVVIDPASSSSHSHVSCTAVSLQCLLDESKLTRNVTCNPEISSLLTSSIFSLASLLDAAESSVSVCRTEMKQSFKVPHSCGSTQFFNILTAPRITLVFSALKTFQDSVDRCESVLLPLLQCCLRSNESRKVEAWPEDIPLPPEVIVPVVARPVNDNSVKELTMELQSLNDVLHIRLTELTSHINIEAVTSNLNYLSDLVVRISILEISMALLLLQDEEVDVYNLSVSKALKKKKNLSSKLHYGKALQRFVLEMASQYKSITSSSSMYEFLIYRCISGGILSLSPLLGELLIPLNKGSRRPKVAKGSLDTIPKRMVIRDIVFELIKSVKLNT